MSKLALIFPGQGSQSIGMLSELYESSDSVKNTFTEASDALNFDLWALISSGPEAELNRTDITQPALLASSVAVWRYYLEQGGNKPDMVAGHSLGEYSALACAGAMSFADALQLVKARGEYMQAAVPEGVGSMAAIIGLADEKIIQACSEAAEGEVVAPVNFNSPGQVVIAGNKAAVDRASALCKEAGAKRALPLSVSVPSHCALMKPAAEQLAEKLEQISISAPEIPVVNNVDVQVNDDANAIKDALVRQLYCPVRWVESVENMAGQGVSRLIECGPGKVLTGLIKRIDKTIQTSAMSSPETVADAISND